MICILNVESPSYPPDDDERRQCSCPTCLKDLERNKMTKLQDEIINTVNKHQGIKATDLTIQLVTKFLNIEVNDILNTIDELVNDGALVRVIFEIPHTKERIFYLPKDTKVGVVG